MARSGSALRELLEAKRQCRERLRARLAAITPAERRAQSNAICERIREIAAFRRAAIVFLYRPLAAEVDISPLWRESLERGCGVYFPRVQGSHQPLRFVRVEAETVWARGAMGIWEPTAGDSPPPEQLEGAVIIVPGLGFSPPGERLGRGKGYYDRTLLAPPIEGRGLRIGVAFREQLIDDLPVGPDDVSMHVVATADRTCSDTRLSLFRAR